jgi:hypothetical protein
VPVLTPIVIAEAFHYENSDSCMAWLCSHLVGTQKEQQS